MNLPRAWFSFFGGCFDDNRIVKGLFIAVMIYISTTALFYGLTNINDGNVLGGYIVTEFKKIGMPKDFEVNNFNLIRKIGGGRTLTTRFYTNGNIEDVKKYYQENLLKEGWVASNKSGIYTKGNLELAISFFNNYWSIDVYPK